MNSKEIQSNTGTEVTPKTLKPDQNRNRDTFKKSKKRAFEKRCKAGVARSVLFDIKRNMLDFQNVYVSIVFNSNSDTNKNTSITSNISTNPTTDINEFKHYFFKEKSTDFSRLPSISKLLLSQFVLNNQSTKTGLISVPFVYRYSVCVQPSHLVKTRQNHHA